MNSILIITDRCAPVPSSNAACVLKVTEILRRKNTKVTIISLYDKGHIESKHGENYFSVGIDATNVKIKEKLLAYNQDKNLIKQIVSMALDIDKTQKFDFVLSMFRPIESVLAGIEISKKLNIRNTTVFFDLPIMAGLPSWRNKIIDFNNLRLYKKIIKTGKLVVLKYYKEFFEARVPKRDFSKIEYAGVPNLLPVKTDCCDNKQKEKNLVYTGSFYEKIRNPRKMLEKIKTIIGTDNVLHIYSGGCEEIIKAYKQEYGRNLIVHGKVSQKEAFQAMAEADILINLSNDDKFQVPGKIMEYFSFGKPVINFRFREDDAGNCEYEKYPIIYNIDLFAQKKDNIIEIIKEFAEKKVAEEEIKELFFDSTPEYFVSVIEN